MNNLDWSKISDDHTFQRLVNDLFALETNNPGFLSSNPAIGADGGWDGRFVGSYLGVEGVWSFQSKWTKHNLSEAYKHIHRELVGQDGKGELQKSQKNGVDYLLLATNADLKIGTDDHVGNLEKLNDGDKFVKTLYVWPRANLETRIKQYPWLRHLYFGDAQSPMFIPPEEFRKAEKLENRELINRKNSLDIVEKFISDEKNNILVVHTGGGYGKSHFIAEVGDLTHKLDPNREAWFCRPFIRDNVGEAMDQELDHGKNYILFLDDAERYPTEVSKLIAHVQAYSPGNLKLVLSCRTSGIEIVKNILKHQRQEGAPELELPAIPEDGLMEILYASAGRRDVKNPERIVRELNSNLYLISTVGKLIQGGDVDPRDIKLRIKTDLEQESVNAIGPNLLTEGVIKNLLRELAVVVPVSDRDAKEVVDNLSSILSVPASAINEAIEKLVKGKVLRRVGSSFRFNPDMRGDIYLSTELDNEQGETIANNIIEHWLFLFAEKVTANIADASRHVDGKAVHKAIANLIRSWINDSKEATYDLQRKRLRLLVPIVYLAPQEAIALIETYLTLDSLDKSINRDDYGPVIYQLLHIPGLQRACLKIIRNISGKSLHGTYSNYDPKSLTKNLASQLEIGPSNVIESLAEILEWIQEPDCTIVEAQLAVAAIEETLAGSHEQRESYGNTMTFKRPILRYDGDYKTVIDLLRDKAMKILHAMLNHPVIQVRVLATDVLRHIGYEGSPQSDIWVRIESDREKSIDYVKKLLEEDQPFALLGAIEDALIAYWAQNDNPRITEKAGSALRLLPLGLEYLIFRYFTAKDLVITDFEQIEKDAPFEGRWSWLVYNRFRRHDSESQEREHLEKITAQLAEKYKTSEEIIKYLNDLYESIKDIRAWYHVPLMEIWGKLKPEIFTSIIDQGLLSSIPKFFHLGIYRVISDRNSQYIDSYAEESIKDLSKLNIDDIDNLLDLIGRHNLANEKFMPWLKAIMPHANSHLKHIMLHRLFFIFKDRTQEEKNEVVELLDLALEGIVDDHVLDMFDFLVHNVRSWSIPESQLSDVRGKILNTLKDAIKFDFHTDQLLGFAIQDKLTELLSFVEYRLKKYRESERAPIEEMFDPIPHGGFKIMRDVIKTYEDFCVTMDKINLWKEQSLIYSFDIENLMENIPTSDTTGKDYLTRYVEEKIAELKKESLKTAINILHGVDFHQGSSDLFLNLLFTSEKLGLFEEAKDVFTHRVISGGYSSTVGEAPPVLVAKKDALLKMSGKVDPGAIKTYIDSLAESMSKEIQRHIDDGQEIMNPKH